tara:strand:- start:76 stop:285 length:210 start_codon:yes stop_codon:yes gene_type:complete
VSRFSVTVAVPKGTTLVPKPNNRLHEFQLVLNDGWATFYGEANTSEDFELDLIEGVDGMPDSITAVEAW